jgi:hypothetical protein
LLKARLPKFLTPRRKYQVDESYWLVKVGKPKVQAFFRVAMPKFQAFMSVATPAGIELVLEGRKGLIVLLRGGGRGISGFSGGGRKVVVFFQWGRMPASWELSFVGKMKSMEAQGIQFPLVLKTYLSSVMGDAPSETLLHWVGRKNRNQPKQFTNAVRKMFGKSAKPIITGLEKLANPEEILRSQIPEEAPYQSLVDAIKAADEEQDITQTA